MLVLTIHQQHMVLLTLSETSRFDEGVLYGVTYKCDMFGSLIAEEL
jgi:hypothetical protein